MRLYSKGFPRNTASCVLFSGIALSVLVVLGGVCGVSGFCGVWAVLGRLMVFEWYVGVRAAFFVFGLNQSQLLSEIGSDRSQPKLGNDKNFDISKI